jgi:hypothetical protein
MTKDATDIVAKNSVFIPLNHTQISTINNRMTEL